MATLMFSSTPSIRKAVSIINNLDGSKFPLLLSRILQKLHMKDERTFSEEEEERLQSTLSLEVTDLELLLQTLEFFLQQLDTINWRLNLQMAQSTKTKQKIPNAMLELGVSREERDSNQKIRMEFTHEELYQFYNQLETIQKQLDGLS
ncbi:COMDA-like protein [Mya arenaria]|uniref:COMDA-like protein n=1 Tax=Mya arenaria TaxID=6604 RepID=A0ABY7G5W9_MYAAR|nr:COMDA-like protein [Mya arenaria]